MATHGKARQATITALESRKPFKGSSMSAIEGAASGCGRMSYDTAAEYRADRIAYTVLSYGTPIAWVTADGTVKVPAVTYSPTTTRHQHLCRAHL